LFFNVTEKLKSDEKFEIKPSTMTAGIRGTSGIIYYDENAGGKESLMVTDGVVELSATNPDTNETRTATVKAGQKAMLTIHPGRIENSVEFDVDDITEDDLSGFTLTRLAENDALMDKVCNHTGWNKNKLKDLLKDAGNKKTKPSESASSSQSSSDSLPPETKQSESPTDTLPVTTPTRKPKKKPTKKPTRRPTRKPTKRPTKRVTKGTTGYVESM
jgi:cell division septation protein DedD